MKATIVKTTETAAKKGFVTTLELQDKKCPITGEPLVQRVMIKTPVAAEINKTVEIDLNAYYTERYQSPAPDGSGRVLTSTWLHRKVEA